MPDVLWKVLAENGWLAALTLAGLVAVLLGPWALIRVAMRRKTNAGR